MKFIYFLFLFFVLSFSLDYLAVSGTEGTLVHANISISEGDAIYLNVKDTILDEDLINSFHEAYNLASNLTGVHRKVEITFDSKYITGPSGGLNTFLYLYSKFKHKPYNYIASGEIYDGQLYAVGGLYEKSRILTNKTKILVPYDVFDYLLIYKNNTYVVHTLDEALDLLDDNYHFNLSELYNFSEYKPNNTNPYVEDRLLEYLNFLELEYNNTKEPNEIAQYYETLNKTVDILKQKKYYYAAANLYFLAISYTRAYLNINSSYDEYNRLKQCVNSVKPAYKYDSLEQNVGGIIRYYKAKYVLENTNLSENDTVDATFNKLVDIEEGIIWCQLSKQMFEKGKGNLINQSEYKDKATSLLIKNLDSDAMYFYLKGDYLSAYILLKYYYSDDDSIRDNYTTLWGRTYASQAYLLNDSELYTIANVFEEFHDEKYNSKTNNNIFIILVIILFLLGGVYGIYKYISKRKKKKRIFDV